MSRTRPRRLRVPAALLAAGLVLAGAARGGVPLRNDLGTPIRWDLPVEQPNVKGGRITWYVESTGSTEEPPGDVSEHDAVAAAFATWEKAPGSPIRFLEDNGRSAYKVDAGDRVNYLSWQKNTLGPFTLAVTRSTHTDGVLKDADVIFNDTFKLVKWATTTPGTPNYADIESVAAHEIGHLIGLDHCPAANATMNAVIPVGTIHARTLTPDDVGAVAEAYGGSGGTTTGAIIGSIRIGRRKKKRGIPVFALDARTGEVAGSTFSDDAGYYRIRALPPGPYRVVAAPLVNVAPYSSWWSKSPRRLLPAFVHEDLPDGSRIPEVVMVEAAILSVGRDIRVDKPSRRRTGEPDDDPSRAREVAVGAGAAGLFEEPLDTDWFYFDSDGTNALDVRVRSWQLGSEANPELAVFDDAGTTLLASNIDLRPPVDPENFHGPEGVDLDPALLGFRPPAPGRYRIRVRAQPQSESGGAGDFYTLLLLPSADVADVRMTGITLTPASTRAGDGPSAILEVIPRNARGETLPLVAQVTYTRSDEGGPREMIETAPGKFNASLPAPATPGEVVIAVEIVTPGGTVLLPEGARLTAAGPPDAVRTTLAAVPRRVAADGKTASQLVLTPRDTAGRPLGPGLSVAFLFEGVSAGTLGTVLDRGDGTYTCTLTAPGAPGSARITATIGGEPTGTSRLVGFGWDLLQVALDLGAEVRGTEGLPGLSRGDARRLGKADVFLARAVEALAAADEAGAARETARAAAALERAGSVAQYPDADLAASELAEALLRRGHTLLDPLVIRPPNPGKERLLGQARALLARGETQILSGDAGRGARSVASAIRKVRGLL